MAMLPRGAAIGAYRIVDMLGQGGMGMVYVAEHTLLHRRAAIKVLRSSVLADDHLVKRFFQEARAVSLISDPGIVQIFDFGHHTDGNAFLVMELLDGEPMDSRLRRVEKLAVIKCLRLMRLACTALEAAHAKGIVHRDLKPGNIFLIGDSGVPGGERIKILDFGVAKLLRDDPECPITGAGMLMGTPAYMSPEQCRGAGDIDARSDIYSLGCVMFAALTGAPPFRGRPLGEIIAAHLREPAPLASTRLPGIPSIVDHIIERCLEKSPADRFPSMTALGDAIGVAERALRRAGSPLTVCAASASPESPTVVLDDADLVGAESVMLTPESGAHSGGFPELEHPEVRAGGPRRSWRAVAALAGALLVGAGIVVSRAADPPSVTSAPPATGPPDRTLSAPRSVEAAPAAAVPARTALPVEAPPAEVAAAPPADRAGSVTPSPSTSAALPPVEVTVRLPPLARPMQKADGKARSAPSSASDHGSSSHKPGETHANAPRARVRLDVDPRIDRGD
ncbi:MAG TPA: serine/threonine-protein kinase [Kofleriaceae bacterium]|nr:serine/threonine-protein kinase [Kofleriaceae bacterium]